MTTPERTQAALINEQFNKFKEIEAASSVIAPITTDIKSDNKKIDNTYNLNGPRNHHIDDFLD